MKSRRKRYRPVTEYNIKTPHRDNKVISKLHTINKEIEKISGKKEKESHADPRIISLKKCVEELGGLDAYQSASKLGEAHHGNINSAKWVLQKLKELNIRKEKGTKLKLLDVGALDNHYRKQKKWIDCTAIDLNPQNGCIIKADFFTFQNDEPMLYDIIVLSLVLNFVGSPARRGEMLKKCRAICKPLGHLFIVLPLACLENSRYLSHELFQEMLESLGCNLTASHSSQKLSFVMCQFTGEPSQRKAFPKTVVRNGIKRNNFSIVMTS
ncbi:25S rRNA (adenine(2142)-N(1))-methyltransferase-like isoform X1 [Acanthaster planci]|uniref:S-adenosylmethionine sensor upstream of mTORC1 n=1 Tax=Acanthaster planci TaxID=133434 RepID=A0A8B7YBG1_ACAPL|nr:25S rRNA (adenine(2142)-N(1))-methyltransferase-like isoform X1 [Acanthaster planci]